MASKTKYYAITLVTLFLSFFYTWEVNAQYFLYNDTPKNIEIEFVKHSLEASSKQVFFNTLKIKNKSNKLEVLQLNVTVPQGWKVIGNEKYEISINPLDSIILPARIAVGPNVRGDIGYSVIASLTDSRGNTIKNAYCFIKIPHEYKLNVKILGGISYLDPNNSTGEFSIQIINSGNREEAVNLFFDGKKNLAIGPKSEETFSFDISIPPYRDTILTFNTKLITESIGRNMFNLEARVKTTYSSYNKNIWFNKLDHKYTNLISISDKPLSVELISQGLLDATTKPTFSAIIEGKTYLPGDNDIYYYYRNFASNKTSDFYNKTRMYLGSHVNNFTIEFGDNIRTLQTSSMFGRGGYFSYKNNMNGIELIANKTIDDELYNIGGSYTFTKYKTAQFSLGSTYNFNKTTQFDSRQVYLGSDLIIKKNHRVNFLFGYNIISNDKSQSENKEIGGVFNYYSNIGNFYTSINANYFGINYYSPMAGRLWFSGSTKWNHKKGSISLNYAEQKSQRELYSGNSLYNTEMGYREGRVESNHQISKNINVYWGPMTTYNFASGPNLFQNGNSFSSINYKLLVGARVRLINESTFLTPRFEFAKSKILDSPFNYSNNNFGYQYFSLNFRTRFINLVAFYSSGPRTINDQITYANQHRVTRRLQFIPAFDGFIYKDVIRFYLGLSYTNNITTRFTYSNITGQIYCYLPKAWTLSGLFVYSLQKRMSQEETLETYQTFYAEASIKKEFDLQHPRVKFHDLEFSFFKDFNGNYLQDENEPGIKNVLVRIEKVRTEVKGKIPSDFFSVDLLSNNTGRVNLENIPEGLYKISYNPLGKEAGNFSKAKDIVELNIDRSGSYYFPFVEKNKVFGKIVLNRSKLSGIGKVDVSNIRITATDSRGNTHTTLTDKNGEFTIFAPVTDQYVVNINNIFYENFDLRQNNFRVQFNGYKQFEVNFVFDEKIRRINFSPSTQDNLAEGVTQIRRTNLRGTIKDATSLKPLRARINLINTKNNSVAMSIYSNPQTGDYSLSFMADDIFALEILADDYWYFSENLNLNQVTTFMNVTKDILLKQITIGSKIELNIRFIEINKATLGPETVAELNRLLRILRDNSNIKIEIQGHCDDLEAINNPQIGEERAKAVAKYLIENGFSNLQIRGFGNTSPIVANDTEENRTLNRRVEIEVISK